MRKVMIILSLLILHFPLNAVAEETILTVSGNTGKTSSGPVTLTMSAFEAIDKSVVETKTPWHKQKTTFSGVSGAALLKFLEVDSGMIEAVALNDYKVLIPVSDLAETGMIFATRKNGEALSVREKGPVFVVYPFDANSELNNEVIYGRSIWQLKALNFK